MNFSVAEGAGLVAREMAVLMRGLFRTIQDILSRRYRNPTKKWTGECIETRRRETEGNRGVRCQGVPSGSPARKSTSRRAKAPMVK